jgi:hypothetical protein
MRQTKENTIMKLYTIYDLANQLDRSIFTVKKYVTRHELPGRILGGTWITTDRELKQYLEGKPVENIVLTDLFDVKGAAKYLNVDISVIRRLQKAGRLKGQHIDQRGRSPKGGTVVFTYRQLNAAEGFAPSFAERKPGRPTKGNVDQYIEAHQTADDVTFYSIRGTYDANHNNYTYKNLYQARKRARQAYGSEMVYKRGDTVQIYVTTWDEGDRIHRAWITHDVTVICRSVVVKISESNGHDGVELIVKVPEEIMDPKLVVSG